jgi:hypothetical protein
VFFRNDRKRGKLIYFYRFPITAFGNDNEQQRQTATALDCHENTSYFLAMTEKWKKDFF